MPDLSANRRSELSRRGFLAGAVAVGVAAACSADDSSEPAADDASGTRASTTTVVDLPVPDLTADPFVLGVASGDPLPEGVLLWTRLLGPEGPAAEGDIPVRWTVAADDAFEEVVAEGTAVAPAQYGHAVHQPVDDLDPATTYWYRFEVGDFTSPIGRTRTAPAAGSSPDEIRVGVASCQAYQSGYYGAYGHLAEEDLDVVLFLGDYIYELESSLAARPHGMEPPATLDGFRAFYELNKRDEDLQAAHAAFPWIVTWDDHEVEDNYAALVSGEIGRERAETTEGGFPAIRAAAYQAWWEHLPVRAEPPQADGSVQVYRSYAFGDLVDIAVLDTRQYRDEQAKGEGAGALPRSFGGGPQLPEAFDPDRTMLGDEQEAWLFDELESSDATWNVIAQQSVMAEVNRLPTDPDGRYSMDSWDGYVVARQRVLDFIADNDVENVVSIGGDIHTSAVTDLHLDPKDDASPIIGSELIAPSISALELLLPEYVDGALSNPHIHLYDIEHRGYLVVDFTPEAAVADYVYVATDSPDAPAEEGTSWKITAGQPGATPA